VHGLRGRTSNRKYAEEYRRRVVEVYHRRYEGFGPTLAEFFSEFDLKQVRQHLFLQLEGLKDAQLSKQYSVKGERLQDFVFAG